MQNGTLAELDAGERARERISAEGKTEVQTVDPYWNHIPRAALLYSVPVLVTAFAVYRGWVGTSRDYWLPLAFVVVALWPATLRRGGGLLLAHKSFQNRDYFSLLWALLPAGVWSIAVHLAPTSALAYASFVATMLVADALALRYELIVVYALTSLNDGARLSGGLAQFSTPFWMFAGLGFSVAHTSGSDSLAFIGAGALALAIPVWLVWGYLRRRRVRPEYFTNVKRVAVIGGGWAGIYATKSLHEAGLLVTTYERTDSVGGVWKFRSDRPGGVSKTTRATASKHFLHASDFPIPAECSEFMEHEEVLAWLNAYVDHFGVRDCFRLNEDVISVEKIGGSWHVTHSGVEGKTREDVFDAVVVCSGPHQEPNLNPQSDPLFRHFSGRIMQAGEYKSSDNIASTDTVLVVGAGESSADIVAECAATGANVYWSTRRGQWFADRNMGPYPADHITTQGTRVLAGRFFNLEYLTRRFVAAGFVNLAWGRGGHGIEAWIPDAPYLHQFLNKSRDGVLQVYSGKVKARRGPERTIGKSVYFCSEKEPVEVDTIILATGYKPTFPFLKRRPMGLYRLVFTPDDPTLAFAGFARPIVGSIPSLSELQSRWLARVWSGAVPLPCADYRKNEMALDKKRHRRSILDGSDLGILQEQELYATDIASRFGAQVRWLRLFFSWPKAFIILLISPWAAFKYRFNEPNPQHRRAALQNMIDYLPTPKAPAYLLAFGIVVYVSVMAAIAAGAFALLPNYAAMAALACAFFLHCLVLRLSERRNIERESALREVFPF